MSNAQDTGTIYHVGFVGDLHITAEQSDALADYYTRIRKPSWRHAFNISGQITAIQTIEDAMRLIGLHFEPMSTSEEGYYLAGPTEPTP